MIKIAIDFPIAYSKEPHFFSKIWDRRRHILFDDMSYRMDKTSKVISNIRLEFLLKKIHKEHQDKKYHPLAHKNPNNSNFYEDISYSCSLTIEDKGVELKLNNFKFHESKHALILTADINTLNHKLHEDFLFPFEIPIVSSKTDIGDEIKVVLPPEVFPRRFRRNFSNLSFTPVHDMVQANTLLPAVGLILSLITFTLTPLWKDTYEKKVQPKLFPILNDTDLISTKYNMRFDYTQVVRVDDENIMLIEFTSSFANPSESKDMEKITNGMSRAMEKAFQMKNLGVILSRIKLRYDLNSQKYEVFLLIDNEGHLVV